MSDGANLTTPKFLGRGKPKPRPKRKPPKKKAKKS